jgi:autotransporter-associated beta strand protein
VAFGETLGLRQALEISFPEQEKAMNRQDKKKLLSAALAGVSALFLTRAASAQQQDVWNGTAGDSQWTDATNWSLGTVPTSTNQAYFSNAGNGDTSVSLGGANQSVGAIVFDTSAAPSYDIGTTAGDILSVFSNNVSGGFNGVGAISITAAVTSSQEIDASVNLLGSSPIITNLGTNALIFGSAGTSATFHVNVNSTSTSSLQLTPNVAGGTIVFNEAITGTVGGVYTAPTGTSTGATSGGLVQGGAGTIVLNAQNTYSGYTYLNSGQGTIIQIGSSSIVTGGNIVSGPFGISTLTSNKSSSDVLEAVGTNQTFVNPMNLVGGIGFGAATNTAAYNLTLTGPVSWGGTASTTITNKATGQTITLGAAGTSASTFTLSPIGNINMLFNNIAGSSLVINDVIRNNPSAPVTPDTITYGQAGSAGTSNLNAGTVFLNGANTYSGSTIVNSALSNASGTTFEIGVSSIGAPGSIVSGPFGQGTIVLNSGTNNPASFIPNGADQTVANALLMNKGFIALSNGTFAHSMTFSGPITVNGALIIDNDLVSGTAGSALYLGAATSPSTLMLGTTAGAQLAFQPQPTYAGTTFINDYIQDAQNTASGTVQAQNGALLYLNNATNSFSGGLIISNATVVVSSDGNMGSPTGQVSFSGATNVSTLLSQGTFTSARTYNLAGGTNIIDATGTNILTLTGSVGGAGDLTKGTNSGTLQLALSGGFTTTNNVNVNGGTLLFGPTGGETGPLSVGNTLTVNSGALAAIAPGLPSNGVTNSVSTLTVNGSGRLDLANSNLITTTPVSTIRQYLIAGYNTGGWNGTGGIMSSSAATNAGHLMALGYTSGTSTVGMGLGLSSGQTLVKYVLDGDANLDGKVDINDLNIVLSNYLSGNPGTWDTGDFKYAGSTDINDLNIVLSNYLVPASMTLRAANAKAMASSAGSVKTLTGTASPAVTAPAPGNDQLELVVNTVTGDVELYGNNVDIASLQTTSAGSIITANWQNLHSHGYTNWQNTKRPDPTQLSEYDAAFSGSGDYAAVTGMIDYGDVFNINDPQDLVFQYGQVQSNDITVLTITGSVYYTAGVPEPTSLSLLGLAAAGLMGRRRAKRRD